MGIFQRKSAKLNGAPIDTAAGNARTSHSSLMSPPPAKVINGQSFSSPSIPDVSLPAPPDPSLDPAAYLRSVYAVRERCATVYRKARAGQLNHFEVDLSKWRDVVDYVTMIIKRDYAPDYSSIPAHGRWQHFEAGGRPRIDNLLTSWPSTVDAQERTRRLIDLFLVSVLLGAGAGTQWSYKSKESGKIYRRSEGLAIASLEMFKAGFFSSEEGQPCQVDALGLRKLNVDMLARGLQVSEQNPLEGLEGRAGLLERLSTALRNREYFGNEGRPGGMLDYLLSHPTSGASSVPVITVPTLWSVLMNSLGTVWPPTRTIVNGTPIGDAWPCQLLSPAHINNSPTSHRPNSHTSFTSQNIIPFHKLTQWLCYSLMTPMTRLMRIHFAGTELLTGLPEYRNGGLFIDTGLLMLKQHDMQRGLNNYKQRGQKKGQPNMEVVPLFETQDDVIVEWRAVTVGFLDQLVKDVNQSLGLKGDAELSLAQVLEAGSWKGGRELAEVSRPNTKAPPIMIMSDGTVF